MSGARGTFSITYGRARADEQRPRLRDEVERSPLLALGVSKMTRRADLLARWRGMDGIEAREVERERVRLVELERVAWLASKVNPNDLEASPGIPHRGPTTAAEQVQQSWLVHDPSSAASRASSIAPFTRTPR